MDYSGRIIAGIQEKTGRLIEQYKELGDRLEKSENQIQELKKINEEQIQTIKQLEKKIQLLKITSTIETKEGKVEAKARINELVREIDKCIGLLNK